jgi:hypothetical protein
MKSVCPLCGVRRAKRACPGVNRDICAVCCGTKRLTEIACPSDCAYLSTARAHPAAVVQRQQERDMAFVLPRISDLSQTQYRLFLFVQAIVLQHAAKAMPPLLDTDVAEASATVAATIDTARSGIIYEHQARSMPAQRLADEGGKAVMDIARRAGAEASQVERDAAVALRRIERLAREAALEVPDVDRQASSWLAIAERMMGPAGAGDAQPQQAQKDEPRIIIP